MKFQLVVLLSGALAAAYAPLSTLAAECSAAQLTAANVLGDGTEFETACADVFNADPSGDASLDPATLLSGNAASLAVLGPCKQPTCAVFLQKQLEKVPDCEVSGVNARLVYKTIVDFCSNASVAPKTAGEKVGAGGPGSGSGGAQVKIADDDSGSGSGMLTVPLPNKSSTSPTTEAPAPVVGDKDQDKATSANTKSDANSGVYAGATAIVAGALLTVLCM